MEVNIGKHFFSKEDKLSDSQILRFQKTFDNGNPEPHARLFL